MEVVHPLPLICGMVGIEAAMSTTYHPQTNGQTERVNQELEQYLQIFVRERQDDWYTLLPLAEFSYNNHIHSSTQQTPFLLDTGRHPRMGFEPHQPPSRFEVVNEFTDRMKDTLEEAKSALAKAKDDMAWYYNRRRSPALSFSPSDIVRGTPHASDARSSSASAPATSSLFRNAFGRMTSYATRFRSRSHDVV